MTNSLQGAEAASGRQVTLDNSLIVSGVLFDDARGADGAATTTARSGIIAYGNVEGSHGRRPSATRTGSADDHRERDHGRDRPDRRGTGPDPCNPAVRACRRSGSSLLGGLSNSGAAAALAAGNFWGERDHGPVESAPSS